MPAVKTKYFGEFDAPEVWSFFFPAGLPGFEHEQNFLPIELPAWKPLVFLQSMQTPDLCFLAFPVLAIERNYHLTLAVEELESLGFEQGFQPEIGRDILLLAILSMHDNQPATANLLAPIVVNIRTGRAVQAVRRDAAYSHQHPLPQMEPQC